MAELSFVVRCCVPSNTKNSGNIEPIIIRFSSILPFSYLLSMFAIFFRADATKSLISVPTCANSFKRFSKLSIFPLIRDSLGI